MTQKMRGLKAGDWTGITFKSGKEPLKHFLGGGGRKADLHLNLGDWRSKGSVEWTGRRPLVPEITRAPGFPQGRAQGERGGWPGTNGEPQKAFSSLTLRLFK